MLQRLWEQNKRFILTAGSGLAAFLILNWFVGAYIEGAQGKVRQATELEKGCRNLIRELKGFHDEKARLGDYEKHEAALRGELELPEEPELKKLEPTPLVQFNQAIDRTWGLALEKANRATVAIPEKLGPQDFGVERSDGKEEYARHYAYLGVVRRALHALIDAGMTEIGRPELINEELMPVLPQDESVQCLLLGVKFRVAGPYDSFARVLKSLQAPQAFLQVNVISLGAKGGGDERTVKGELEFTTFRIVEGEELKAFEKPASQATKRPQRKR